MILGPEKAPSAARLAGIVADVQSSAALEANGALDPGGQIQVTLPKERKESGIAEVDLRQGGPLLLVENEERTSSGAFLQASREGIPRSRGTASRLGAAIQEPLGERVIRLDGQDGYELAPGRREVAVVEPPARPAVHVV